MVNQTFKYLLYILIFFVSFALTNTRVSFSRPGSLIRMPFSNNFENNNQYSFGFSNEIINTNTYNKAKSIYVHRITPSGLQYGIAYSTHTQINNNDTF